MEPQNGQMARQPIVRTEEQILSILDEYEKSGFSRREYCELNSDEPKGFAAVEVISTLVYSKPQLFAEVGNNKLYKEVPAD